MLTRSTIASQPSSHIRDGRTWLDDRGWGAAMLLLAIATVAMRARFFGNPLVDADEEFYLLVGDRLLHGAIPYVDIWDRKPIGLFLIYAGIRLLGGNGILAYQLVAAGFAAATAVLIACMARRITSPGAALVAALAYAPLAGLSGGQGGQAPIFYNLPVALAAWLLTRRVAPATGGTLRRLPPRWSGASAMLLIGLAMQIKPNAVFEGIYFGIVLLWLAWKETPRIGACLVDAIVWIAAALLPSALAAAAYLAMGHGAEFVYANYGSIFARGGIGVHQTFHNLGHDLGRTAPLLAATLIAEWLLRPEASWQCTAGGRRAHAFLIGWAATAAGGFLVFGTYFNHYVLPLLPPLSIVAAPTFAIRPRRIGAGLAAILLVGSTTWYGFNSAALNRRKGSAAYGYQMAARLRPLLSHGGCLFVFYGDPVYYHLTHSCLPTRWPFPFHLSLTREAPALGIDPATEMHRILGRRPAAILDVLSSDDEINSRTHAILHAALARDYRLVYSHPRGGRDPEIDQVWQRLPGR